jgi:hypothetical protein
VTRPSYAGAANATDPPVPPLDPGEDDLVEVFVTVAVRCSDYAGHGVHRVGRAEAARLTGLRQAVYGSAVPRGFPG